MGDESFRDATLSELQSQTRKRSERITWAPWTAETRQTQVEALPQFITTFRKGTKWLKPELVGQRVELFDEGKKRVFATAVVFSLKYAQFAALDDTDYARQSTKATPQEMLEVMRSVYDDYEWGTGTTVITLGGIELV